MRQYKFNAIEVRDSVVDWIKNQAERVVIGISGGKDSTIAAALCCRALGAENVHGLLLPNGIQSDINDSIEVCDILGVKYDTINIKPIYDAFVLQYKMFTEDKEQPIAEKLTYAALINLPPRIRMSMLRMWGQSHHHRLCGTGNFSEITVGYCTKDGDTSCDFNPLGKLTSLEVVEVGITMDELPQHLVRKIPTDGLCGITDEEKLGVSYIDIHKYIRGIRLDNDTWYKIRDMELAGMHKRNKEVFNLKESMIYIECAGK